MNIKDDKYPFPNEAPRERIGEQLMRNNKEKKRSIVYSRKRKNSKGGRSYFSISWKRPLFTSKKEKPSPYRCMNYLLTSNLKSRVIRDYLSISTDDKLIPLPRTPSVSTILWNFVLWEEQNANDLMDHITETIFDQSEINELYGIIKNSLPNRRRNSIPGSTTGSTTSGALCSQNSTSANITSASVEVNQFELRTSGQSNTTTAQTGLEHNLLHPASTFATSSTASACAPSSTQSTSPFTTTHTPTTISTSPMPSPASSTSSLSSSSSSSFSSTSGASTAAATNFVFTNNATPLSSFDEEEEIENPIEASEAEPYIHTPYFEFAVWMKRSFDKFLVPLLTMEPEIEQAKQIYLKLARNRGPGLVWKGDKTHVVRSRDKEPPINIQQLLDAKKRKANAKLLRASGSRSTASGFASVTPPDSSMSYGHIPSSELADGRTQTDSGTSKRMRLIEISPEEMATRTGIQRGASAASPQAAQNAQTGQPKVQIPVRLRILPVRRPTAATATAATTAIEPAPVPAQLAASAPSTQIESASVPMAEQSIEVQQDSSESSMASISEVTHAEVTSTEVSSIDNISREMASIEMTVDDVDDVDDVVDASTNEMAPEEDNRMDIEEESISDESSDSSSSSSSSSSSFTYKTNMNFLFPPTGVVHAAEELNTVIYPTQILSSVTNIGDIPKEAKNFSDIYGGEHLLRLVLRIPEILCDYKMTENNKEIKRILKYSRHLTKFLEDYHMFIFCSRDIIFPRSNEQRSAKADADSDGELSSLAAELMRSEDLAFSGEDGSVSK
ncbi:uncharacterized protein MONOS_7054 [Monocercomonoides exilis]|uniref:uncharacterized protein n=1 Tax=Monocercomonoides exilis TaxID=2049356 RepID=UPI0035597390|nr:hypothetical protein MONOS_7054 [Monocercomonoides exilis]|eukprot:MONOS_7054.1-p1 / transcript=MONOS_7054.1 / gene=MONOS_7054 / organism=Monocercomonoides_exilis_PA203 / gene_product=unspecified product / transcript_product=unspecified product / location=Mono_scaffold00233:29279-32002(+) / protein_length=786 / sequence_SO=supercontig / SO=protein_coding / is_pseudo=false